MVTREEMNKRGVRLTVIALIALVVIIYAVTVFSRI